MSAALLANSDRQGWPSEPAACFWASLKSLCDPGFAVWRRFVALTMWRNSAVRSLMAIAILAGYVRSARMAPEWADDGCRNVEKAVSPMEDYVRMNAYMCSNSGSGGVVRFCSWSSGSSCVEIECGKADGRTGTRPSPNQGADSIKCAIVKKAQCDRGASVECKGDGKVPWWRGGS